uniref:Cathepsin B cysteine protease n=1 Tax=Cryptocaryon irritans TaxID=153251 RepID=A0A1L2BUZ7_9CILI|nr:cathepsin B cysteine protease [Cryptocaryon irritans]
MQFFIIVLLYCLVLISQSRQIVYNASKHIKFINSAQNLWKAGHNDLFQERDLEFAKHLMGSFNNTPEDLKLPVKTFDNKFLNYFDDLPEDFDSRKAWPKCQSIFEIRDQSNCGSCWAFGASEVISDRICIASNQKLQTRISSRDLLSCCDSCGDGCNGGYPEAAFKYWVESGIVTGDLYNSSQTAYCQNYPFIPCAHHVKPVHGMISCDKLGPDYPTPECKRSCQKGYPVSYKDDLHFGEKSYTLPNDEKAIMAEIMQHGPVEAAFSVYSDFIHYKSGIYKYVSGESLGGHAIKIIGWGVENGTKFWIIANSWNTSWGENGTFRIVKGIDECGIESQIVAGIPKLKKSKIAKK